MKGNKKLILMLAFALFVGAGIVFISLSNGNEEADYETPSPEKAVEQYFTSWGNKNYPDMYAAISDGFKKIEPTAKDLRAFKEYAESQGIDNVERLSIKETSNDGRTATVDYNIEF